MSCDPNKGTARAQVQTQQYYADDFAPAAHQLQAVKQKPNLEHSFLLQPYSSAASYSTNVANFTTAVNDQKMAYGAAEDLPLVQSKVDQTTTRCKRAQLSPTSSIRSDRRTSKRVCHESTDTSDATLETNPASAATAPTYPEPNPSHKPTSPHELKRMLMSDRDTSRFHSSPNAEKSRRCPLPKRDQVNRDIAHMRCEQRMTWSQIATLLNDREIPSGRPGQWTETAIYGRFRRNQLCAVDAIGSDNKLDTADDTQPERQNGDADSVKTQSPRMVDRVESSNPMPHPPMAKFTTFQDEQLLFAYEAVSNEFWDLVADRLDRRCGVQFSGADVQRRFGEL
jgi:hypothetical protein